jgi:hypothetical protein
VVQAWRGRSGRLLHMPKPPATWSGRELVEPRWGTAVEDWGASLYETRHLVRSVLSIEAAGGRGPLRPCSLPSGLIRTSGG